MRQGTGIVGNLNNFSGKKLMEALLVLSSACVAQLMKHLVRCEGGSILGLMRVFNLLVKADGVRTGPPASVSVELPDARSRILCPSTEIWASLLLQRGKCETNQ